ncbi:hypothetical protein E1B28_011053 [Marasmius oreades]|uniref:Ubiquinone biosynthesis protein n=1 Tax=Marasmius oreades TaxID=181124 RepID=A0A9P7RTY0_9AGAR|nr:uncharacterized protein E1B28_011053 [Marasmius oreades]KAG7089363.1 hypothetical protein E1B28_011053 [Marasmius oreades]
MSTTRNQLLKIATTLVKNHGFTREALSYSALYLPGPAALQQPLSEPAISALFGTGDSARVTLINAWLDEGILQMSNVPSPTFRHVLRARLEYNREVLGHLPEAFALLCSPEQGLPPLDPRPAIEHAAKIANETCKITKDQSIQLDWYARRASLATIYIAAELHQLKSPQTANMFLDDLLDNSDRFGSVFREAQVFSSYVFKSWDGILRSKGFW